jgi:hypothetical protein
MLLLGVIAAGTALLLGFGVLAARCTDSFNQHVESAFHPVTNEPVRPIPVSRKACTYLREVGARAEGAAAPWVGMSDAEPWRPFQARLNQVLPPFAIALAAAIPHVPTPVARDLTEVLRQVEIGRATLPGTVSMSDYLMKSDTAVYTGTFALAHASSLVGDACGARVLPALAPI